MKKIVSTFLALFLLISFSQQNITFATSFKDIPEGHQYYDHVEFLVLSNVLSPGGNYFPDRYLTREEFAIQIVRAKGIPLARTVRNEFKDINGDSWTNLHIQAAADAGFIKGFLDGTFKPKRSITRAQYATMIQRAFDFPKLSTKKFPDVNSRTTSSVEAIEAIASAGVISGFTDGNFRPNQFVKKGQAAKIFSGGLFEVYESNAPYGGFVVGEDIEPGEYFASHHVMNQIEFGTFFELFNYDTGQALMRRYTDQTTSFYITLEVGQSGFIQDYGWKKSSQLYYHSYEGSHKNKKYGEGEYKIAFDIPVGTVVVTPYQEDAFFSLFKDSKIHTIPTQSDFLTGKKTIRLEKGMFLQVQNATIEYVE